MAKLALLLSTVFLLGVSACEPVTVTKTLSEQYTDRATGKLITYTESITQVPESRLPIHLKHAELEE